MFGDSGGGGGVAGHDWCNFSASESACSGRFGKMFSPGQAREKHHPILKSAFLTEAHYALVSDIILTPTTS